jgi:hypothetical protein
MRRALAAFGVVLLVCLFLGMGAYTGGLYGAHRGYQAAEARYSAPRAKQGYPQQIDRDRAGLPDPVESIASNPDPEDGTEREKRDLAAQEAMVVWSFWTLAVAVFGFFVTTLATGLLYWQIKLTRKAVEDTGRATLAMQEANALSRETRDKQLRAYVTVLIGDAVYQDEHLRFAARPTLFNVGSTPASNVRWRIAADILPAPLTPDVKLRLPQEVRGGSVLGQQQSGKMIMQVPNRVQPHEIARTRLGIGQSLYVWGVVTYEDIFKRTHRTTFFQQLFWDPTGPIDLSGTFPGNVQGFYMPKHNRQS